MAFVFALLAVAPATAAWAVSDDMSATAPGFETNIAAPLAPKIAAPAVVAKPPAYVAPAVDTLVEDDEGESIGSGNASWYGAKFAGKKTASGERFNPGALTAAHRTLPFGSKIKVTSKRTGQSIVVRVNDRGPFHANRLIDLSEAAAAAIGVKARGQDRVELSLVTD